MRHLLLFLLAFSVFSAFPMTTFAATYYVDGASLGGTCNDSNNGTALTTPWCTIQKAATNATAGDSVNIRGATYRESATASNSGTANNPITFQSYGSETPIINGADVVSNWVSLGAEETGGLFSTGFETGNFSNFNSTTEDSGNTVTDQTSIVNNGTYAMLASFGGTNKNARANKTLTASNDVYSRMYFRVNSSFALATTSSRFDIMLLRTSTTTTRAKVSLVQDGSGNLSLQGRIESPIATTFYSGSAGEIQKNTWYYVELRYKGGDASTGGAELWLDGVSKGSNYTQNTSGIQISRIEIGGNSSSATQPNNGSQLFIDDMKANTSPVGAFTPAGNANIYQATNVNWTAKTLFEDGTRIGTTSATTFAELTGPNNWYLDTSTDTVSVWLPGNANPNAHTMEASRRDKLFDLSNRNYVTIQGLTLQYNRQNSATAGGIYLSGSSNNTIQNNTVKDNFGTGIYLITSTTNRIQNNTLLRNMRTFGGGLRLENGSNNNTLSNNTITGENGTAGNGIFFCGDNTCNNTGNNSNTLSGNTISQVQDTCVYFDTNNDSNTIEKNICHDSVVDTSDSTKGGNGIHIALGGDDNIIQNNLVYNMARHGISLRDGNTSQGYVSNYRNVIYNNTVYNMGTNGTGNGIDLQGTNPNSIIKNNISVLLGTGTAPLNIESNSTATVISDYNLLYNTTNGGRIAKWNGTNYTSLSSYQSAANQDMHSLSSDPQFANTSNNNYQLGSSSPAIDAGTTISSLTTDLAGISRPQKCAYDLGSYEFSAVCSSPSSSSSSSSSNPSSGPGSPNPNFPAGYLYQIMSGPNYKGTVSFINGTNGAEGAMAFVGNNASVNDLFITITKPSIPSFYQQLPRIPFPWQQRINAAGDIYYYNALAAFNGMQITQFSNPVTIVLPYDPKRLYGVRPSQLRIAMYDTRLKIWRFLPNTIINTKNNTAATTVNSFSYFVVGYWRR